MVFTSLSTGSLADILSGTECGQPVLQVLGIKRIPGNEGSVRYRLLVSDGKHLISYAMLATQLNSYADEEKLTDNTIIRIEKHIVSVVSQEKKVVVILDLTVLHPGTEVKTKIGNPQQLSDANLPKKLTDTVEPVTSSKPANGNGITPSKNTFGSSNANASQNESTMSNHMTTPIANLTPYQNKWVIKARVTSKSNVRTWNNARGEGKLFSMDLMDESGEIRATCFKEACDKYFEMIQPDKVYFISKCQLKSANKQYTTIKNDYEMTFNSDTMVEECFGGSDSVPKVTYNLVPLSQISQMEPNAVVDIGGVCREVGDIIQFVAKTTGRELKKRDVTLVDRSSASVSLTLWGQDAENFDGAGSPIVFIKGGKINEFGGGKSISMSSGSTMKINPDISEAHQLRGWYDNDGRNQDFSSVSARTGGGAGDFSTDWVNFYEAKARSLGATEKPDYFQCKAIVHLVKTNSCVYKSCPKADCNKKVLDQDNGVYRCEKCMADGPDFKYRILLNTSIADWTTNRWVTLFSDQGEKLLERTSQEVGTAFDNNKDELEAIVSKVLFKSFIFKLRSKVENFGDSQRSKIHAMNISPINYKEYNAQLIKNIQARTGVGRA